MSRDLFDEPRAKLERAAKHIAELTSVEDAFNASEPVIAEVGIDKDGNPAVLLRATRFPDLQASAIAGDVLNNLRCSLDLAVNAACRANDKTNLSKTYFPIISKEDEWSGVTSGKHNRMKAASPAIKKLAKSFKPWKSGNPTLHALSRLVGLDKHQAIIAMAAQQGGVTLDGLKLENKDKSQKLCRVEASTFVRMTEENPTDVLLKTDPGVELSLAGPNQVRVLFGFEATDIKPYVGAVELLHAMGRICQEVVETFAAASTKGELV